MLAGTIVQINTSPGGIPKRPALFGEVTAAGLAGDACRNMKYHGGPKQALLLLCAEAVDDLIAQGFPLFYGALGENLTVRGIDHREFRIGQRWRLGPDVEIELTKIRVPCQTLNVYGEGRIQKAVYDTAVKAGNHSSPLWAKGGIYASVITGGRVEPGDAMVLQEG